MEGLKQGEGPGSERAETSQPVTIIKQTFLMPKQSFPHLSLSLSLCLSVCLSVSLSLSLFSLPLSLSKSIWRRQNKLFFFYLQKSYKKRNIIPKGEHIKKCKSRKVINSIYSVSTNFCLMLKEPSAKDVEGQKFFKVLTLFRISVGISNVLTRLPLLSLDQSPKIKPF